MITLFERIISSVSDLMTLVASSIAIYLFIFERQSIVSALKILLNYSNQLTLTDLKSKIDRLNDHHGDDPNHKIEIINILHEIEGQISGNKRFKIEFEDFLNKMSSFTKGKKEITEPIKRLLVSELRELLRNTTIENTNNLINKN